ncbi:MAG: hypothetical protein IJD23_01260 [Spirochaetaceae bacterium]|nr:hypothetical protein [Spirochaetaceae bacterium]
MVVQITSNLISGQDLSTAIDNIDMKSVVAVEALSGAVTGVITSGLSSISTIKNATLVYKTAKATLNAGTNAVGTTVGTIADNKLHNKRATDNLGKTVGVSAITIKF